jgi:Eukaryotic cytochrome b561
MFILTCQLLNTAALLLQVQSILVLQPTSTPRQKTVGTYIHSTLVTLSVGAFIAAFAIIEINKGDHARLTSPHGILGLITYIVIILQALVGVAQFWVPKYVFGSVDKGKSIFKYHRAAGYALLVLELVTVGAATQTGFNVSVLHVGLGVAVGTAVLVVLGVGARIKKQKLGL